MKQKQVYVLEDPLTLVNGEKVRDVDTWVNMRRPELLELIYQFEYGFTPEPDPTSHLMYLSRHRG